MIPISRIKTTQRDVEAKKVKKYAQTPAEDFEPVQLWRDSSGLRVYEGNHRIHAAIARGETHIKARIWSNPYK